MQQKRAASVAEQRDHRIRLRGENPPSIELEQQSLPSRLRLGMRQTNDSAAGVCPRVLHSANRECTDTTDSMAATTQATVPERRGEHLDSA